jgi:hypothetical protein
MANDKKTLPIIPYVILGVGALNNHFVRLGRKMMPNPPPPEIIMFHIYMNLSHFIFIS